MKFVCWVENEEAVENLSGYDRYEKENIVETIETTASINARKLFYLKHKDKGICFSDIKCQVVK